jgi:hypothetical protein
MKKILIFLLIGITYNAFSQSIKEIDSISYKLCDYLKTLDYVNNDSIKLDMLYQNEYFPILDKIEKSKVEKVGQQLFFRLQRNCVEYRILLDNIEPPKEKDIRTNKKPETKISRKDLQDFKNTGTFKYYEVNGDFTKVTMQNGKWIDTFIDSTFSDLNYKWISEYEFELTFNKSNNETRSNFSVKGDKFIYRVIDKKSDYYILSVQIEDQYLYEIFRLYKD